MRQIWQYLGLFKKSIKQAFNGLVPNFQTPFSALQILVISISFYCLCRILCLKEQNNQHKSSFHSWPGDSKAKQTNLPHPPPPHRSHHLLSQWKTSFAAAVDGAAAAPWQWSPLLPSDPPIDLNLLTQSKNASSQTLRFCRYNPARRKKWRIQSCSHHSEPPQSPDFCANSLPLSLTCLVPSDHANPSLGLKLADLCLSLAATGQ